MNIFLNEEQQKLAQHITGPCICTAVAGSGKTTALVENLKNKITYGADTGNIVATTYTKEAAQNILYRLKKRLGKKVKAPWIGTTHAIGYKIIREKCKQSLSVIPGWKARKLIGEVNPGPRYPEVEKDYLSKISFFKNRKIFPFRSENMEALGFYQNYEDLDNWAPYLPKGIHPQHFHTVWTEYEKYKQKEGLIDFDDMLIIPYVLMATNHNIREHYQGICQYVLVDEYQDTNEIQYLFFRLMAEPQNNIMVVGDDDQAIYSFRGAYPKYIRRFQEDYPDAKLVQLEKNYRSQGGILDAANMLIVNNFDRYEKQLVCTKDIASVKPSVQEFITQKDEAEWVAKEAKEAKQKNKNLSEYAVLARTNSQLATFEAKLIENHIPYIIVGSESFFEKPEVEAVLDYFKIAISPESSLAEIKRIANKPYRKISKDVVNSWTSYQAIGSERNLQVAALFESLQKLHSVYNYILESGADHEKIVMEIFAGPIGLLQWARYQSIRGDGDDSPEENLLQIYDLVKSEGTIYDVLGKAENALKQKEEVEKTKNGVILSTIHKAKGLEWNNVFVVGCCDGILPHSMAESIEEERRLMYVAITRARESLSLSYFLERGDKEYDESLFLSEMEDKIEIKTHKFSKGEVA